MVTFEYCDAHTNKEIDVVLTEDEFFNEDVTFLIKRIRNNEIL